MQHMDLVRDKYRFILPMTLLAYDYNDYMDYTLARAAKEYSMTYTQVLESSCMITSDVVTTILASSIQPKNGDIVDIYSPETVVKVEIYNDKVGHCFVLINHNHNIYYIDSYVGVRSLTIIPLNHKQVQMLIARIDYFLTEDSDDIIDIWNDTFSANESIIGITELELEIKVYPLLPVTTILANLEQFIASTKSAVINQKLYADYFSLLPYHLDVDPELVSCL